MKMLQANAETRQYLAGDLIFSSGEPGNCLYAVLEGEVRLSWHDGADAEVIAPGQVFGEGALVQPAHQRYGTAVAQMPTTLLVMNRQTFLFAVQTLPLFAVELLASLEGRLQALKDRTDRQADLA